MDDKRSRFEVQVLPHLDAAYRLARWLSHSHSDAEDIAQEALLRAFRAFDSLRGSDVKAWLLAIVRNCYRTAYQQQLRRASVPLPSESDHDNLTMIATTADPQDALIATDNCRTLDQMLAELPAEYREVLVLREIEDMSYREIATVIDAPIGTVMSRLARARTALKVRYQDSVGESHALR